MTILRNITGETPSEKPEVTPKSQRNELFDFIDNLDSNTPIIGPIVDVLKNIKNFFTEKFSFLFSDSQAKLSALRNEVEWKVDNFVEKAENIVQRDETRDNKTENANSANDTKAENTKSRPRKWREKSARGISSYATAKSLQEEGVKLMKDLTFEESKWLAYNVFGKWPGTELLVKMDGGKWAMIQRMVALGEHEWKLKFGRQNPDPASGFNIWTFQIGGSRTTKADSMKKYENCFHEWVKLARQHGISVAPFHLIPNSQRDLIAHLWYIQSQRGGESTFAKLRDPNLKEDELIHLMHRKIQGGIRAIGVSVVAQIKNNHIDTTAFA